jgi:hypothetical protein
MKSYQNLVFSVFTTCILCIAHFSSEGQVSLPGTKVTYLESKIVDQRYELHISLPRGYETSEVEFDVVYILDSQWDFPLIYSIYGQQYYDGFLPPLILVGITWGGEGDDPNVLRVRDFTPTPENGVGGGAASFLEFIKSELHPFLESNYKVSQNKTLIGSSLGGLFTIYAAFNSGDFFSNYIPTSPALTWGENALITLEKDFNNNGNNLSGNLYSVIGGLEPEVPLYTAFMEVLEDHYPDLNIDWKVLEGMGHSGCKAEGNTRGLQFAYQRPDNRLPPQIMDKLTGEYESGKTKVRIAISRNQLFYLTDYGVQYELKASSKNEFYVPGLFFNLHFNDKGFVLERFWGTETFNKQNQ